MAQSRHTKVDSQATVPKLCAWTVICNLIIKNVRKFEVT